MESNKEHLFNYNTHVWHGIYITIEDFTCKTYVLL